MVKLVQCAFLLLSGIIAFNFYSHFRKERSFFGAFVKFCNSKLGEVGLNVEFLLLLYNMCNLGIYMFFGGLQFFEMESIKDRLRVALADMFMAPAVFTNFSSGLLSLGFTLFIKCFHFAFEARISTIEHEVVISVTTLVKSACLFVLFLCIDLACVAYLLVFENGESNIEQLMICEYVVLAIGLVFNVCKLGLHYFDYLKNYTFHRKAAVVAYLFIFKCLFECIAHLVYFLVSIPRYGMVPILFVRPLMFTMSDLLSAVKTQINSNRVMSYINHVCPDTTEADVQNSHDTMCVVCREEISAVNCKKLPCNHMFHYHCLKSWFQRQQTCPICRLDIISMINKDRSTTDPPTRTDEERPASGSQETNPSVYEMAASICTCSMCEVQRRSHNITGAPLHDPSALFDIPLPEALKNYDPAKLEGDLIRNVRCNLEAATVQLEYLETIVAKREKASCSQ